MKVSIAKLFDLIALSIGPQEFVSVALLRFTGLVKKLCIFFLLEMSYV